jgi:hypothetical protein
MKKIAFLASVAVLLAFAACTREEPLRPKSGQPITVDAGIGVLTRATTTGDSEKFDIGDKVALYVWTGNSQNVPANLVVNGVENTLQSDGSWVPASVMYWQDFNTAHFFLGIYPARTVSDFKADSFTLKAGDYEANDLLVATEFSGLTATNDPVKLNFKHAMARLQVNMNFRNQFASTPTVAVSAKVASSCKVNYLTGTVDPGEQGSFALTKLASAAEGYALSCSSIVIPQSGFRTVILTIEGTDFVYTHDVDIQLSAGSVTVLNLIVGRDKIELDSDLTIEDWTSRSPLNGEAQDE